MVRERMPGPHHRGRSARVRRADRDNERTVAAILEEFRSVRDEAIALVSDLRDDDLDRSAVHIVVGRITVRNLLHEWGAYVYDFTVARGC